ncbi:nuclease-related domain-containing protein [Actinomadura logoneensis]|uniref:nuclease-related domain-containing protein n=1 Tax=Actinomadura logoneensis TaxID=2293572 RepID=UPI001F20A457|nr:nuclease-related domain-containing protein [Actinomadura logoneensis]
MLTLILCGALVNAAFGVMMALVVSVLDFYFHWHGYNASSVWRRGLRGEQRTDRLLRHTLERRGHRVVHARSVPGHEQADEILVGPGGVWLIHNEAWHPETEIAPYGGRVFVDGRTQTKLMTSLTGAAETVARLLTEHTGEEVTVRPLLVVHGGRLARSPFEADGVVFATPLRMLRWIRRNPTADYSPEQVEALARATVHVLPIGRSTAAAA